MKYDELEGELWAAGGPGRRGIIVKKVLLMVLGIMAVLILIFYLVVLVTGWL